jgi:hypothetical protein
MGHRFTCWFLPAVLAACSPTLNWREVRPEGGGIETLFPCKPVPHQRRVALAGAPAEMTLLSCRAGSATYAVGFADVGEAQRVSVALAELQQAAVRNVGAAAAPASAPLAVPGMTPGPAAQRWALSGQRPDGTPLQEQLALFAKGTRVYQAAVVGRADAAAVDTFFGALRLP